MAAVAVAVVAAVAVAVAVAAAAAAAEGRRWSQSVQEGYCWLCTPSLASSIPRREESLCPSDAETPGR